MALLYANGWDDCYDYTDVLYGITTGYADSNYLGTRVGRGGRGRAMDLGIYTDNYTQRNFVVSWPEQATGAGIIVEFACDITSRINGQYDNGGIYLRNGAADSLKLFYAAPGVLGARYPATGALVYGDGIGYAPYRGLNSWIQVKCGPINPGGPQTLEVICDGIHILNYDMNRSGQVNFRLDSMRIDADNTLARSWVFDDLIVMDTSGDSCNDLLGDSWVRVDNPISDEGPNDGTPATGTDHYAMVDDEYISEANDDLITLVGVNHTEMFGFPALPSNATVHGLQILAYAKTDIGGSAKLKGAVRADGTLYVPTAEALVGSAYLRHVMPVLVNPDGDVEWNATAIADINAMHFGVKRTL